MKHDSKPLTLEELKQMDGQPVWIEDIEYPQKSQWRIISWDNGKYLVLTGMSLQGYTIDQYGESWLAYSYKPIDFDNWEPCSEICKRTCHNCDHDADEVWGDGGKYCKDCKNHSKWVSEYYKFCVNCGRPLTNEARKMLENRLKGN